jgi:BlaI family penicillinase repressor
MARERQDITEAEMAIMQVLWNTGPSSIRQITDSVHSAQSGTAQYATVQKQLERLEAKGFIQRDRRLFVHLFTAAIGRDELIGRQLREMAEKLCGGSLAPILSHLAKAKTLTDSERQALRDLISESAEDPVKQKTKPKGKR